MVSDGRKGGEKWQRVYGDNGTTAFIDCSPELMESIWVWRCARFEKEGKERWKRRGRQSLEKETSVSGGDRSLAGESGGRPKRGGRWKGEGAAGAENLGWVSSSRMIKWVKK
ncbi:hypothetical protein HAX54_029898 [Datura stramonium]|uniref:Uncharacterized protein n=1 Tax=Datura stramonium TaxID=4076 RepID=A0ABS8V9P9_DATST|nr:hypothetical protein [Datura stramonium]